MAGRAVALLASAALILAMFLPWTGDGTLALDLGLRSWGRRAGQPTVAFGLVMIAALPSLAAVLGDAAWPRLVAAVAAGGLALSWLAVGPDGGLTAGVVATLIGAVGLLAAAAFASASPAGGSAGAGGGPLHEGRATSDRDERPQAGFAVRDHTADMAFEAWGSTRGACFTQAVRALVSSFADTTDVASDGRHAVAFGPAADEDLLVDLLDEVIYLLDARGVVPVGGELVDEPDGGISGELEVAPVERVRPAGAVPKAVTHHALQVQAGPQGWRCHAVIDV
ncbi:MAG: archease [Actinobacteria bacterium]|nr:archease [Actinomycetota bacterium]